MDSRARAFQVWGHEPALLSGTGPGALSRRGFQPATDVASLRPAKNARGHRKRTGRAVAPYVGLRRRRVSQRAFERYRRAVQGLQTPALARRHRKLRVLGGPVRHAHFRAHGGTAGASRVPWSRRAAVLDPAADLTDARALAAPVHRKRA